MLMRMTTTAVVKRLLKIEQLFSESFLFNPVDRKLEIP